MCKPAGERWCVEQGEHEATTRACGQKDHAVAKRAASTAVVRVGGHTNRRRGGGVCDGRPCWFAPLLGSWVSFSTAVCLTRPLASAWIYPPVVILLRLVVRGRSLSQSRPIREVARTITGRAAWRTGTQPLLTSRFGLSKGLRQHGSLILLYCTALYLWPSHPRDKYLRRCSSRETCSSELVT